MKLFQLIFKLYEKIAEEFQKQKLSSYGVKDIYFKAVLLYIIIDVKLTYSHSV